MKIYILKYFFVFLLFLHSEAQIQPIFGALNGPCTVRPPGCVLNCANDFVWGFGSSCLCLCRTDPCANRHCPIGEICEVRAGFAVCGRPAIDASILRPTRPASIRSTSVGECPTLVGGSCLRRCESDTNCRVGQRCCSNGCGTECVQTVNVAPIQSSISIRPLGQFPQIPNILPTTPANQITNAIQTTTCLHLLSAVQNLPNKHLTAGYLPTCTANGRFAPAQCDQDFCWCVNPETGHEIFGTKVELDQRASLNCASPRECEISAKECQKKSKDHCAFGWQTDSTGCPSSKCECRNLCEGVTCDRKYYECQLIEPDCASPPCQPIPKCILNPCPNGPPATLSNGVTALCTDENPCFPGYWCHNIGYNGLGFCCPEPESAVRSNTVCEARAPRRISTSSPCESDCRVDADCPSQKCCYDGCALKCSTGKLVTSQHAIKSGTSIVSNVFAENKALLETLNSECPVFPKPRRALTCETECQNDGDCHGMRKCCSNGCSKLCAYPVKTTPCLHDAITVDVFGLKFAPRCNSQGEYHEIQCDGERCYCAEPLNGLPLPGSLVPTGRRPLCSHHHRCEELDCGKLKCAHGNKFDENGCPTCDCKNPCLALDCREGSVCIMTPVRCTGNGECKHQPRCVPNICQGQPAFNHYHLIEQCSSDECPNGFACLNFGLPGKGGLCCPLGISGKGVVRPTSHPGQCPFTPIQLHAAIGVGSLIKCRVDADCALHEKCCFDGSGVTCTVMDKIASGKLKVHSGQSNGKKPGECQLVEEKRQDCRSGVNECTSDDDCAGILKCCFDGCFKKCLPAFKTTPCNHLKAALEPFGKSVQIRCTSDGEFEPTQCNDQACWCVDLNSGQEIEGTRVSGSLKPECKMRRVCVEPECVDGIKCPNGRRKDSNGCNTCECESICQNLKCPSEEHVCVGHSVLCIASDQDCPQVPKCIPNLCRSGRPLMDKVLNEVRECSSNSDCPSGAYCRRFGWKTGYCCGGPDNQKNPGACPRMPNFPIQGISCSIKCRQDNDCKKSGEICCFNGCGVECMPSGGKSRQTTTLHSIDHSDHHHAKIRPTIESTCPKVEDLGHSVCGSARDNQCEMDNECPSSLKCCFDGCLRSCLPPHKASNCVHSSAAVQALMRLGNSNLFQPLCTSSGDYARVQSWRDLEWCVNSETGLELPGTRTNSGVANCDQPRSCPALTCQLQCDFGFQLDSDGCEECVCLDPCSNVVCPLNHVCRMVEVKCADDIECQPVPKCLLNTCLRGEPLTRPNSKHLIRCNNKHKCAPGWFCNQFGMESGGYCCAGIVPDSQLQLSASKCSPTPIAYSKDFMRSRQIQCRLSKDCDSEPCCFNGYGTDCVRNVGRSSNTHDFPVVGHTPITQTNKQPVSPIKPILNQSNRGTCPQNIFHNPGCQLQCHADTDCNEHAKCCEFGCGRRCLYPDLTTACIHRLSVLNEEKEKAKKDWKNSTECASNGLFRKVQCRKFSECWCVNPSDGKEIIGTRTSSSSHNEPNCIAPRKCSTDCQTEWLGCEHGIRLDHNGCPLNNRCECRNPCEDFECAISGEICVLRAVKCLSGQPCPKQPTCRPSPCFGRTVPLLDHRSIVSTCRRDFECTHSSLEAECRALATTEDEEGHKVGICCAPTTTSSSTNQLGTNQAALGRPMHLPDASSKKVGLCPLKRLADVSSGCTRKCEKDEDCSGVKKCCGYGCSTSCESPSPATNCMQLTIALEKLKSDGIEIKIGVPTCDQEMGNYVNTQCDETGNCWCVDKITGAEITATRHSQPTFNVCESERRKCAVECSDELTQTCPFGLDLDVSGCPRTSQCRCRNPCDQVECRNGEICLLRSRDCVEDMCLPVPVCEPNPCSNGEKPVLEARGFSQFACFHNRTRPCPSNYHCLGFDQREIGVCCPPTRRSNLHFHEDAEQKLQFDSQCPHGPPYSISSDDQPTVCSLGGQNTCPSTHYCVTPAGQVHGICCPTKRFVCNLEKDISTTCNRPTTRFYFDADSQQCIPYVYGGCETNLNSFETETQCMRFCIGIGSDPLSRILNEDSNEMSESEDQVYSVGFSLIGPLNRHKHTQEFNERLRDYLMATYSLSDYELRDLYVRDDNTVRFNLIAPNAQQKAANISQAVSSGKFAFRYGDESYEAVPQTYFSQQIDTNMKPAISGALFWILLVASTLFGVFVLCVLWCACSFIRSRSKDNTSIFRGASPSPYGQISAYIPQDGGSLSGASSRQSHHQRPQSPLRNQAVPVQHTRRQKTSSADDLRAMERENRQLSITEGSIAQFLSNPLGQAQKRIQRPKIVDTPSKTPPNQRRSNGNISTVFY